MQRFWIGLAALFGLTAVAMAAYAAHGIHDADASRVAASGIQMQGWHALALLGTALWLPRGGWAGQAAATAFGAGTVLFCGAVYTVALTGTSLGPVAPAGGTVLMLGWLLLGVSAVRAR